MSEPTLIDLPVGLRWIKLVCRLGRLVTDSAADENAYPDLVPVGGKLTLSATPSRVRIKEADGRWRSVDVAGRTYTIRSDGELVDEEGRVGVYIPDPSSLLVEPQNYTIGAVVKPTGGTEWRVTISGSDILPDVVDLVAVSSVGTASPSVTASFDARLYALEQGGGGGGGVVHAGVIADDTPAKPAEGQSASYLVTSTVVWPANLVWSTEPDGDVAPIITGTALVSLFTVDGVTHAVMGATFPGAPPPPDTTAPVAGTLAVVPSSTSALGTVTGASDAVALATAPYSFRIDAGAWSAWQAADTYTWTGLTAETAYTFQHRVRDAAGNITEGAAVTDTTDAAPDPNVFSVSHTDHAVLYEKVSSAPFTYAFTGVDIGPASTDRVVIVGAVSRGGTDKTMPSVTIGGVAATIAGHGVSSEGSDAGFAYATVPTGTTADISVTYTSSEASISRCVIGVWTAPAPIVVGDFGYGNHSTTLATDVGDDIMAIGLWWTTDDTTWTGATSDFLTDVIPTASRAGGASAVASSTSHEVSFTNTSIDAIAALAVRPT